MGGSRHCTALVLAGVLVNYRDSEGVSALLAFTVGWECRMRRAIFTVCANRLVPHATLLLQSARRFLPDFDRFLVLADEPHGAVVYPPDCTVLPARGLDVPDFAHFAFRYDAIELGAALKPFMFLHLLRDQGYADCLYFDPDIELFGPLQTVTDVLKQDASLLLTPHLLAPVEEAGGADDISVLRAGVYNLGFLGARATDETFEVLAWWARWLRWQCVDDQPIGLFVDQKFVDLVPGFAPKARILRDPALNVAGWNVRQRDFVPDAPGGPAVGGRPLGFFHYSGLVGSCADHTGGQPPAFPDGALPDGLQRFVDGYAARLRAAGDGLIPGGSYAYGRFASGTPIPAMARRMFRDDHPAWPGDPFETFEAWMHLPALGAAVGPGSAVPSLIMHWLQARTPEVARTSLDQPEGQRTWCNGGLGRVAKVASTSGCWHRRHWQWVSDRPRHGPVSPRAIRRGRMSPLLRRRGTRVPPACWGGRWASA